MARVIEIEEKKKRKRKKIDHVKAGKASALLKVFECASCYLKCARCGVRLEPGQTQYVVSRSPYGFCKTCHEEFSEYEMRMSGRGKDEFYWYNDQWLEMWKAWTDYQAAIERFLTSKEVLRLRYELKKG
jgi:hypothetical protein